MFKASSPSSTPARCWDERSVSFNERRLTRCCGRDCRSPTTSCPPARIPNPACNDRFAALLCRLRQLQTNLPHSVGRICHRQRPPLANPITAPGHGAPETATEAALLPEAAQVLQKLHRTPRHLRGKTGASNWSGLADECFIKFAGQLLPPTDAHRGGLVGCAVTKDCLGTTRTTGKQQQLVLDVLRPP